MPAPIPTIPGYTLLKKLGEGAMAEVYLAEHKRNLRRVAIKILKPIAGFDAEQTNALFLREARVLAGLNDRNIVTIYDNDEVDGIAFMAMELLPSGTLLERMQSGSLAVGEALAFVVQIAQALACVHRAGIVHRDLKPANIMLRDPMTPVLTDFGIARVLDRSTIFSKDGNIVGTPLYMSPEQLQAQTLDGRSDLYALGVLFFELLTGALPYQGKSASEIGMQHILAPLPVVPTHLSALQPVLNKLLAKLPAQRFASADDFIAELRQIVLGSEALRSMVSFDPNAAWSSQLRALGFTLGPSEVAHVRIAQGEYLSETARTPMVESNPRISQASNGRASDRAHEEPSGPSAGLSGAATHPSRASSASGAPSAAPLPTPRAGKQGTLAWLLVLPLLAALGYLLVAGNRQPPRVIPKASTTEAVPATPPTVSANRQLMDPEELRQRGALNGALQRRRFVELQLDAVTLSLDDGSAGPVLIKLAGGSFDMGAPEQDELSFSSERPVRSVRIAPFALGAFEISVEEFRRFVEKSGYRTTAEQGTGCIAVPGETASKQLSWRNPGYPVNDQVPVTCVSHADAKAYAAWLSTRSARPVRLPSEAELEYAGRAGTYQRYPGSETGPDCRFGNVGDRQFALRVLSEAASEACDDGWAHAAPVGQYAEHPWALFDLFGNVAEWSEDCFHNDYQGAPGDGAPWLRGGLCDRRMVRGGSFAANSVTSRLAYREIEWSERARNDLGFRIAMDLPDRNQAAQ